MPARRRILQPNLTAYALLQHYIGRLGRCLLDTGQEMVGPASLQLEPLLNEFHCLHMVKARVNPREWRSLLNGLVVLDGAEGSSEKDWAKLAVSPLSCALTSALMLLA